MDGKESSAALNASLLLDGEDRILEGNRDAEVFLEKPLEEVRKSPLYKANSSLYAALKELIVKSKRGRGVEDYALAYKVGKRLMRLNISITPYPMEALGTTGTLITINSMGGRPAPERRGPRKEKPPEPKAARDVSGLPQLLDSLADPAFILDMEAVFTYVNPVMCSLMGHAEEEIIGRPLSFFMLREEAKKTLDCLVEAACSAPWRGELEFSRADGTTSNIAVTIDVWKAGREKKGELDCLLGMGKDNTTEVRIRREREEELKRIWNLMESVGLAMVCFTPDFRVTLLSHSAGDLLKTTRDRAIGTPLPELFPEDTAKEIASLLELSLKGEAVQWTEVEMKRAKGDKRGEKKMLLVEIKPAFTVEGKPREYMMFMREATQELSEVEKAQLLLREAETRTKFLELAIANQDTEGYLRRCLEAVEEELGCTASAVYLLEDREALLVAGLGLDEGTTDVLQVLRLRPGYARLCEKVQEITVEIHGGVPKKGWKELQSYIEKADRLFPLFRERRWRGLMVMPLRGKELTGALALVDYDPDKIARTDERFLPVVCETMAFVLSEYKTREQENGGPRLSLDDLQRSLQEAVAVTRGASGLREDSGGQRNMVEDSTPTSVVEEEHDFLEVALEAKRIKPSQNHLSLWGEDEAEKSSPSPKGIDLPSLIWEIKEYYYRRGRKGEIFLEIEEDLPKLHTDKRLLRESLMQLLDNAMRYSPPGAPVILGVERWGDEVLLRVEDQGPGIRSEVVEEVMQAELENAEGSYYDVQGRLSGLFLTRKYVTALGGDLTIKGRPDEGTTAFIRIRMLPFVGESL